MSVTVTISSKELQKALRSVESWSEERVKGVKRVVMATAINVDKNAKELVPVDTGRLKTSIHWEGHANGLEASVTTNVEYAPHVEFGTKPHKIRAKGDKPLRFKSGGNWVSKWEVDHPGTQAQPFMNPSAEMNRRKFEDEMKAVLRSTAKEAQG